MRTLLRSLASYHSVPVKKLLLLEQSLCNTGRVQVLLLLTPALTDFILLCSEPYSIPPCQYQTEATAKSLAGEVEWQASAVCKGSLALYFALVNSHAFHDNPQMSVLG